MPNLNPTPPLPATKVPGDEWTASAVNQLSTALAATRRALGAVNDGTVSTVAGRLGTAEGSLVTHADLAAAALDASGVVAANYMQRPELTATYPAVMLTRYLPAGFVAGNEVTAAVVAAIAALPSSGGVIEISDDITVTNLVINKPHVRIRGRGHSEAESNPAATTIFVAGGGTGISFDQPGIVMEALAVQGVAGNTVTIGIHKRHSRQVLRDVAVFNMAGIGIRRGTDDEGVGNRSANLSRLDNVTSRNNGSHGVLDDDAPTAAPDANGMLVTGLSVYGNGGDGLRIGRAEISNYHGVVAEGNGGMGIHGVIGCKNNVFWSPHTEQNTGGNGVFDIGTANNLVVGAMNFSWTDNGTNSVIRTAGGSAGILEILAAKLVFGGTRTAARGVDREMSLVGNAVSLLLDETDAAADTKLWAMTVAAGILRGELLADTGTVGAEWLRVTRTAAGQAGVRVGHTAGALGFYGTSPVNKPTIVGSKGGNVALGDLITKLAASGLLNDSTS